MPRSTRYLSRLVTADEPPGHARAPYRRGWGVRGVMADDRMPSNLAPAPVAGRNPTASPPDTTSIDRSGEKRGPAPRTARDVAGDGPVPAAPRRSPQRPLPSAGQSAFPPSVPPPTAAPPARRPTAERTAPVFATDRAARARVGPASESGTPTPAASAASARAAEPTQGDRDAPAPRPLSPESAVAVIMPARARPVQRTAQVAASLPRAAADRRARSAPQPAAVPSIRIGTIDVHVAAPPALAQEAHLLLPRVAATGPGDTERLSRPAAVFGIAQG